MGESSELHGKETDSKNTAMLTSNRLFKKSGEEEYIPLA